MSSAATPIEDPKLAPWARWSLIVAGPAAIGLGLAARSTDQILEIVRLPTLWIGVTMLMLPALYIGAALGGHAPSARHVAGAGVDGLARSGGLLLGLAPALLFLVVTSSGGGTASGLVGLAAGMGALAGLMAIYRNLFRDSMAGVSSRFMYFGWAAVLLGIGAQLFGLGLSV